MKEGWEYNKIGKLCKTYSGGTPLKNVKEYYQNGNIPWLRSGEVCKKYISETEMFITQKGLENSSAKYYPIDTVVVAMYGATATQVGILKIEATSNQAVCGILPNRKFLPEFLYYFFCYRKEFLASQAQGGAQPNISQVKIKNLEVPVPPLPEQQSIVDYLDSAFAKIDAMKANAEKALNEAKALFQASLKEMLEPKDGWEEKALLALTSKIGSGATPKGGRKVYIDEGCHLIRSMNVQYNEFKYEDLAHITDEAAEQLKGVEIQENDVLFNITGASIARCCVVPTDALPARVNQHVSVLRLKQDVLPRFLSYILNSPRHQKELLEIGEAGSTRQALTKTDLENHVICYPNIDSQTKLLNTLDFLKSKVDRLQANYEKISQECDALKQAILRQVFE